MSNWNNVGTITPIAKHTVNLAVYIGRFCPYHRGHEKIVKTALSRSDTLLILIGSSGQARDTYVPFTFEERKAMILAATPAELHPRILIQPIYDAPYSDGEWVRNVQMAVRDALPHFTLDETATVALIGHSKDKSSFYLKLFPQWAAIEVSNFEGISATPIRAKFFRRDSLFESMDELLPELSEPVQTYLAKFSQSSTFGDIIDEFEYYENYRAAYAALPHPPVFVTTDACVIQSGHVLLVQRRSRPGLGLWSLPGGFLDAGEWIDDAVIQRLKEKTKIRVPEAVLRGSVANKRVFDNPNRSRRGRTITHATLFKLRDDVELPKVKGSDAVMKAHWWPLADVKRNMCFEDHYHLISALTASL